MTQLQLLEKLDAFFAEVGLDTLLTNVRGIPVLKVTLKGLGEKKDGGALSEINFLDCPSLDASVFQIFTTVALNIDRDNLEECELALNSYNLKNTYIGAFHVYEPYRQIYHRYTQLFSGNDVAHVMQAKTAVEAVVSQLADSYDDILKIAAGASVYGDGENK